MHFFFDKFDESLPVYIKDLTQYRSKNICSYKIVIRESLVLDHIVFDVVDLL
jgi:hypothetical protein